MKNIYTIIIVLLAFGALSAQAQKENRVPFFSGFEKGSGSGAIDFDQRTGHEKNYEVTFVVDMTNAVAEGGVVFNPEVHQVYISGTFTDWATPGSNTEFQMQPVPPKHPQAIFPEIKESRESLFYSITFQLAEGTHYYKYFLVQDQPTWGLGEWPGEPNREVIITGPATINNVWGTTANFAGGDGSLENPFLVETAEQLNEIRNHPIFYYKQIADIDLGVAPWNEEGGWLAIGNDYYPFWGSFDGNGFKISNLTINQPQGGFQGLFGFAVGAQFKEIYIQNANITGHSRVGILCGTIYDSQIENCFSSGEIYLQSNWAGGLTGVAVQTQFSNSYSNANIHATGYSVGGLTGAIEDNSIIINCYAAGNVFGSRYVGGLAGWADYYIQVTNSYSVGYVGSHFDSGGLIGDGYDLNTTNSYWNIETSGQDNSYGGTPKTTAELLQQSTYANWNFSGIWSILPGETYAFLQIQNEPGPFNYPPTTLPPSNFAAVPGNQQISLSWVVPSLGSPTGIKLFRNDELYQTFGPETNAFIDAELENFIYYSYYLTALFGENESDPTQVISTFANPGFSGGNGTWESPYEVATPGELFTVRLHNFTLFKQVADIDLGNSPWKDGEGWLPIGEINQRAIIYYDGNGYKINNLTINRPEKDYVGLFGAIQETYLLNIALEDVNISGGRNTGALAGFSSESDIYNCFSTGQLTGGTIAGGLVGMATYYSYIEDSYSSVNVTQNEEGTQQTGGLAGRLNLSDVYSCFASGNVQGRVFTGGLIGRATEYSYIIDAYATGQTEGTNYVGGLVGSLRTSLVANSYSTGEVEGIVAGGLIGENLGSDWYYSFWDTETSGQASSYGGTPKTTAAMTQQATFEGWDFEYIWSIQQNTTYPFFRWQLDPWDHNFPPSQTIVEESTVGGLRIFPNPASSILWVELNFPFREKVNIQLMNISGQVVDQMTLEDMGNIKASFNTSALPSGLYLLVI
ncbi:MAG: T9SS type A sorting domain-containing protein, partial [Bacteroidales bacterium]|nr:T9SS type A sorting domain-containing protein [Bacteroidales bacterium]